LQPKSRHSSPALSCSAPDEQFRCVNRSVKGLTYNQARGLLGVLFVLLVLSAGNRYLEWHLFGNRFDQAAMPLLMLVTLFSLRFVPGMPEEAKARHAAKLQEEILLESQKTAEEKANELNVIRRGIGMAPGKPSEDRLGE
jgi:hypothetical protein